jgi:hypothetical protein
MNISISTLVIMAVVFIVLILCIVLLTGKVVAYHKAYEDLLNRSKNYLNLSKNCNKTSETIIQQNKDLLNEREMYRAQLRRLINLITSAEQLHQDNFKLRKEIREVKDINKKLVSSDSCKALKKLNTKYESLRFDFFDIKLFLSRMWTWKDEELQNMAKLYITDTYSKYNSDFKKFCNERNSEGETNLEVIEDCLNEIEKDFAFSKKNGETNEED